MEELKAKIKEAKIKAHTLKSKKAKEKAFKVVQDLEHEAFIILCDQRDKYDIHSVKATVRWFTDGDDYVALETPYGSLYANPTTDLLSKSWYSNTCCITYIEGQEVVVELRVDINHDTLRLELIPTRIYGGTLDEAKYAELCKSDNLAFFRYPGADGVTGLFAKGAGLW